MEGLYLLLVEVLYNCLDADLADNLLVNKALPQGQLLLLKLEEVSALRVCRDRRVDEFGIADETSVKVVIVCNNLHLVLAEYEKGDTHAPPPL